MDILELVKEAGYNPKRKAASHGGEYSSACPFCKDGDDRFVVWPQRHNNNGEYQGGRFSCRVCGRYGDAITFLRDLYSMGYKEACAQLRIMPKSHKKNVTALPRPEPTLLVAENPSAQWMEKARVFVECSHKRLTSNKEGLALLRARGFRDEYLERFRLGFSAKDNYPIRADWGLDPQFKEDGRPSKIWLPAGIVIPTFAADQIIKIKVRRSEWKEGDELPRYVEISGSKKMPAVYGNNSIPCALVLESEIDALLIQQEAGDLLYCVALGGVTKPLDATTDALLRKTALVLFLPDFDEPGTKAWYKWKTKFPNIHRILTPREKSAGDYFKAGGNLREWLKERIGMANARKSTVTP